MFLSLSNSLSFAFISLVNELLLQVWSQQLFRTLPSFWQWVQGPTSQPNSGNSQHNFVRIRLRCSRPLLEHISLQIHLWRHPVRWSFPSDFWDFFLFVWSGISEDERRRRKESNILSTKINFFAWLFEVPFPVFLFDVSFSVLHFKGVFSSFVFMKASLILRNEVV